MSTPAPSTETEMVDLAEQARLAMNPMLANELLAGVSPDLTIQQILELDDLQLNNFLRGLRIRLSSLGQEFAKQPLAVFALPHLNQMLVLLNYYYSSPELQARAESIETDPHGNEYVMLAEMWRDIAGYCLKVAALTGNDQLLLDAQAAFIKAAEASKPETNVQPLAKFEALIAAFNANVPIPLLTLEEYWQEIITRTKNHDRIAKVSWDMMQVARRVRDKELEQRAKATCMEHANHLPGGYLKYAAQRMVRSLVAPVQRMTYHGDGAELRYALPTSKT